MITHVVTLLHFKQVYKNLPSDAKNLKLLYFLDQQK